MVEVPTFDVKVENRCNNFLINSAYETYQYCLKIPDTAIVTALSHLTIYSQSEIEEIKEIHEVWASTLNWNITQKCTWVPTHRHVSVSWDLIQNWSIYFASLTILCIRPSVCNLTSRIWREHGAMQIISISGLAFAISINSAVLDIRYCDFLTCKKFGKSYFLSRFFTFLFKPLVLPQIIGMICNVL